MKLKNKKGKPTGKTALEFSLKYSTAMNQALAGPASNYQVETATVKGTKKKTTLTSRWPSPRLITRRLIPSP